MKVWTYACMAMGLLFFAAPAGALIPDHIEVWTDTAWVTAGGEGTATVTAWVKNSTSGNTSFEGVGVDFVVNNTLGSISPAHAVTGSDGRATVVFRPGTRSGDVMITATVAQDASVINSTDLHIDHAAPYAVSRLWYEPEVTAGGTTDITVRMVDRHGNVVDNRSVTEDVTFMVGSPSGNAAFIGGTDKITVPVDENGNATATLRVGTVTGENIVLVTFPGGIGSRYLTINGLANGEPSKIYQTVSPNVEDPNSGYPELPLPGQFTITYAVYDEYGNPAGNRQIKVNVRSISGSLTSGEWPIKTNSQGKAQITYRSSEQAGVAEIVATAVDNDSVSCEPQKVGFYSANPTDMLLTAVPQTIASGDVKDDLVSYIKAKVMDSKGNPVRNESVSFRLVDVDNGTTPMTTGPRISNDTHTYGDPGTSLLAMSDKDGFATINFHPGAFTRDTSVPGYSSMASGNVTIQAAWNDKRENTTVSFRNYPYLSVNVSVEPQSVAVNGSVNVTVQLIGDGWALQSRPIDVVLCTDRSGSMLQNTTVNKSLSIQDRNKVTSESIDDRMVHAMRAAKNFTSQMQPSKDRIGLVSFGQSGEADLDEYDYKYWAGNDYEWVWHDGYWGWFGWWYDSSDDNAYIEKHYKNPQSYSGPATRDLELTSTYEEVNTTIDKWLPCGGTPMREGLYRSVQMILDNRSKKADPVEAIVLLTDGSWNIGGDPGAQTCRAADGQDYQCAGFENLSSDKSVITYAEENGIKIFTIALGDEPSHAELRSYANQTGGTFYSATAGDDLTRVYEDIATKLQEAAGVNTRMELAFNQVMINSTPTSDVFKYEPVNPVSTREVKYWTNGGSVFWERGWEDQTKDWNDDQILTFDVGDIFLNQTWEATFRLKVLKPGNIDIFGSNSRIRFNGTQGKTELGLPHTFITASLELNETDVAAPDIQLDSLSVKNEIGSPGIRIFNWNLSYTGNRSVIQKVVYRFSPDRDIWWDSTWYEADTKQHPADTDINGTHSSRLDFREKEGWYKIRVSAWEDILDGVSDEKTYMGEGPGGDEPGGDEPGEGPGTPIWVEPGNVGYIKIT